MFTTSNMISLLPRSVSPFGKSDYCNWLVFLNAVLMFKDVQLWINLEDEI